MTTPAPEMPDFSLIDEALTVASLTYRQDGDDEHAAKICEQRDKLRAWLAAQPVAPEGGGVAAMDSVTDFIGTQPEFTREGMFEAFGHRADAGVQQTRGPESNDRHMAGRTAATPPAPARDAVPERDQEGGTGIRTDCGLLLRTRRELDIWFGAIRHSEAQAPAAGAVVVDEAMVKVAMEAYEAGDPWADIPTFCGMRAALTAAIGGAG